MHIFQPPMTAIPTPEDVARVAEMTDLAARNNEVTRGYYLYSERFRTYLGEEATWTTLAAWASAQAGRTIRKEDLLRALERRLGDSEAVRCLVQGPLKLGARYVIQAILNLNPFERSSQAVSRGNIKVYGEIGAEFAKFLALLETQPTVDQVNTFADSLIGGPPPDGQMYLQKAFPAYFAAIHTPPGKIRSELIFFGNLCIGVHEQTRLQPEIEASVDGSVWDALEVKNKLIELLLPRLSHLGGAITQAVMRAKLEPFLVPILAETQRLVREIVTEKMMVLELPGEVLPLGQDLSGKFPENLCIIQNPDTLGLLHQVDLTPDSLSDTGTQNWTNFPQRMHFIADLFRSHQLDTRLFESPIPA